MKYTRKLYRVTRDEFGEHQTEIEYEHYEQPFINRSVYRATNAAWIAVLKLRPLVNVVDDTLLWFHQRHCDNDCGVWTRARTGEKIPGCVHMPLPARVDIWVWHLDKKNNTRL